MKKTLPCTCDPVMQLELVYAELHCCTSNCTGNVLLCTPCLFSSHCLQFCYLWDQSLVFATWLKLNSRARSLFIDVVVLLFKKKKKKEVQAEGSITEGSCIAPGGGETYKLWIRVTICLLYLFFYKVIDVSPYTTPILNYILRHV